MFDVIRFAALTLLLLRFTYWVGSSLTIPKGISLRVLVAQITEGVLVFFFFSQFFGKVRFLPMRESIEVQLIGLLFVCVGVATAFIAKKQLGKEWVYSAVYKSSPKEKLVTKGMYAYIRHPLYTGIVVSYVGAELVAGSWLWVSALFIFIPFFYQARREEKFLMEKFGNQYKKYKEKTKMFLPYIW